MVNIFVLIFSLFSYLVSLNSWANPNFDISDLDKEDKITYQKYFSKCNGSTGFDSSFLNGIDKDIILESTKQIFSAIQGSREDIYLLSKHRGISPGLSESMQSLGFYRALNHCFNDQKKLQNIYVIGLLLSDSIGKLSLPLLLTPIGKMLNKVLRKRPRLRKAVTTLAVGSGLSVIVYSLYNDYRPRTKEEKEIFEEISQQASEEPDTAIQNSLDLFYKLIEYNQNRLSHKLLTEGERIEIENKILNIEKGIDDILNYQASIS
jgi:hypothetical protein